MIRHIARRILQLIPMLLGITVMSFVIIQLSPGDFLADIRLNPVVSQETAGFLFFLSLLPPEMRECCPETPRPLDTKESIP